MYCKIRKLIIIVIILVGGCRGFSQPFTMEMEVPDGPPEYKAGWHDGCASALSAHTFRTGKFYNRTFGSGIYQHDPIYQAAWGNAFTACATQTGDYVAFPGMDKGPLE